MLCLKKRKKKEKKERRELVHVAKSNFTKFQTPHFPFFQKGMIKKRINIIITFVLKDPRNENNPPTCTTSLNQAL